MTEHNCDIMHEILVCLRLSHPNIIRFMAADKSESFLLIAKEYIHGASLDKVLHSSETTLKIEETSKKAYLTDWGLANIWDSVLLNRGSRISEVFSGPLGGTTIYMAPECLIKYGNCTLKSDMWSLGITLLELFTNKIPWQVKHCQELHSLMYEECFPHAMEHLESKYMDIIGSCFTYSTSSRLTAGKLVTFLKTANFIDLK
ncbi:uncharacterized protein LOC130356828 [Hyla sarda]|uniref:uncharacterized protein LOC130356828 n=1 Tax=Hyla sarda TaxID=327740 RepID=UPI0024C3C196|nr:uncharacterized protein LOC130356828 [Hyla sarda]